MDGCEKHRFEGGGNKVLATARKKWGLASDKTQ